MSIPKQSEANAMNSSRQLPIVQLGDKDYYRDDRLREYRAVDNPHDRIPFPDRVPNSPIPLFPMGQLVATPGALEALAEADQDAKEFFDRHMAGDWGDVPAADAAENAVSVDRQLRILSAYHTQNGVKLWVITEADRSATTILLPSEY